MKTIQAAQATAARQRARLKVVGENNRMRRCFLVGLILSVLFGAGDAHSQATEPLERFRFQQVHMGVDFTLIFYAADQQAANLAAEAAFQRIADLDSTLSDYNPDSELSKLSRTAGSGREIPLSDDLWRVLVAAEQLSVRTEGAFDVTVGPLVRLWRRARRQHELPSKQRINDALAALGHQHIRFYPDRQAVVLSRSKMRLDLGAIAKGFATDEALLALRASGCPRAMVDGSGDLSIGDPPPGAEGWKIAIASRDEESDQPKPRLSLSNCGVATSGDVYQFVEIDGQRYSHIVDTRTGLGLTTPSTVTVVAADGMMADSLASAVSVLGPESGLQLIEQTDKAEAIIVVKQDGRIQRHQSSGMASLILRKDPR